MPAAKKTQGPKRSVLLIGSEAQPFSKTGGLADVLGALPSALARLGWGATVALPRYRGVSAGTRLDSFPVTVGGVARDAAFFEAPLADGARALLVECPELYDREGLYGVGNADYPDNPLRFAFVAPRSSSPPAAAPRLPSSTPTTGRRRSRRSTCAPSTPRIRPSAGCRA
jgi:starch synthase